MAWQAHELSWHGTLRPITRVWLGPGPGSPAQPDGHNGHPRSSISAYVVLFRLFSHYILNHDLWFNSILTLHISRSTTSDKFENDQDVHVDLVYRVLQSGSFDRHLPVNFLGAYRFRPCLDPKFFCFRHCRTFVFI